MRGAGIAIAAVGVLFVLGGLLFLVGAGGQSQRYLVGVVGLVLGAGGIWFGSRLFRTGDAASPERIRGEIMALAKRGDGELAEAELGAAMGRRLDAARSVLADLERDGTCERIEKNGAAHWVFEQLLPRLMVRRCPYCEAHLPVAEELHQCPNCGGKLELRVEARSLGKGEHYDMDG
jgi:hypothetical protein